MKKRLAVKGGLHRSGRRNRPIQPPPVPGVMRPDTGTLRLPSDLEEETHDSLLPDGVVLVIVLFWLLFIAIIAWFVAHMPPKIG